MTQLLVIGLLAYMIISIWRGYNTENITQQNYRSDEPEIYFYNDFWHDT